MAFIANSSSIQIQSILRIDCDNLIPDQPGLLLETQSGEIRPARYNLWAEPIYDGVRGFLLMEISQSKGEDILPVLMNKDAAVINVRIDQLHGTHDGQAKLVAYWWLARGDGILSSYLFAESRTLDSDGYAALAAAEKALLSELATRIAGSLVLSD